MERGKLPGIRKLPWQTDTSIGKNSWGYIEQWKSKDTDEIIDDLVDIVSKNGNLLLNVGPKADGTIPQDQAQILLEIGDWLGVNGEAIYNTKYWKIFGEGPTEVKKGHHSEKKNKKFTSKDIRFTHTDDALYAILMAWPEDGKVTVESLAAGSELTKDISISSVSLLGSDAEIKWSQDEDGLKAELPKEKPGSHAFALKLSL